MADNKLESSGKKPSGKQSWQDRKLKKVVRDDIDVISRKTLDQSDFITMLNTHDNVLHRLRMTMGRNKNITFEKAQEFIERSQQIREEINLLNAEMCELMEWDYTPPRGFINPLAKNGEEEEKRGGKKAMSTAAAQS
ncbi:hypothetical protein KI811_15980 [Geobacter hydrogenophilus]|uniref:Uncharacterized protein n=1 Tax=Geobacter hydrogenophilus TaxID=40983 RepID=A0A9W6G369_9BACT|nr:hypothetical protein [Geobacter hydrogenophilus]MBT0895307.1 hypothetical protein [Geobacter hydrogenophilus]GLI39534.1 hypothetical protein GHYDROH2_30350 [Geobacter hydrogenophilus]